MLTVGLTEAKRRFEELVVRAMRGERIRITKYGKIKAEIVRPQKDRPDTSVTEKARKHS
jgi:antitoxin (DNA-binding transcriptional repressor) of toxin-antitoxin stability system